MGVPMSGTSGTYRRIGSSQETRPSFTSSSTAMAVKCLDTDATWKTECGVMGIPNSRFAMPYPRSQTGAPRRMTEGAQPGDVGPTRSEKMESTRTSTDGTCAHEGNGTRCAAARSSVARVMVVEHGDLRRWECVGGLDNVGRAVEEEHAGNRPGGRNGHRDRTFRDCVLAPGEADFLGP
jgi:hypothetical protein